MRASRGLLVSFLTCSFVAVPVVSFPALGAPGDDAEVTDVLLEGVDAASVSSAPQGLVVSEEHAGEPGHAEGEAEVVPTDEPPAVLTPEVPTEEFTAVGFSWDADSGADGVVVQVRVREDDGWSEWYPLPQSDDGPDDGTVNSERSGDRAGTGLLLTSGAEAVQVRADAATEAPVEDLRAVLIDPGDTADEGPAATAGAVTKPGVISRAQWGAGATPTGECAPAYSSELKAAVVHHTVSTNSYAPEQSAGLVRSIYLFHTRPVTQGGRGWCDIGYNAIVDRYGQIFEGAAGGLDRNVIGAHAGGFNTYTFGVSTLGDFQQAAPPAALTESVSQLIAWKLELWAIDPRGTTQLTSRGGGTAKYAAGTTVTLPVIMGHRDVGSTACPGQNLYDQVGAIRARVTQLVGDVGRTLLRTAENPAVFVVSGSNKYEIGDLGTLQALSPLGPVGYVSQQFLDRRTTVSRMSRVVLSPGGSVYFIDAGIKLPFGSCAQVAAFGASCDSLVRLEQPLIDAFHSGPPITPLYRTTSGKAFYVTDGVKREVVDDAALTAAGLPTNGVRLLESGIGYLPYGVPVTRPGVVLQNRGTGAVTVSTASGFTTVAEGLRAATALSEAPVRPLDDASMRRLSVSMAPGAIVKEAGGTRVYLLTDQGRRHLLDAAMLPASVPEVSAGFLGMFPDAGSLGGAGFVKGSGSGAVYVLREGQRRVVSSWSDLVALNGGNASPAITTIDQRLADLLPAGPAQLGPGALVHSPRSAAVFFVNGRDELIPVWSFSTTGELGANRVVRVADADVDAYTVRAGGLGTAVNCAGTRYLGLGGKLYRVGSDVSAHYNLSYTSLDAQACAALPKAGSLTRFLRADSGAIYYMENGVKRAIRSYGAYVALGGTSANTIQTSDFALSLIATGPAW
ncbi:hypothetical protein GCM10010531_01650 [Blastococcus jejuensis]|uniref:Peptidoglycan recognition protein family domain-containing protein n=1 Tax=Blastococcus jejuensis TaxID=351224 RepID=A0ABP6NNY6_9ACTN